MGRPSPLDSGSLSRLGVLLSSMIYVEGLNWEFYLIWIFKQVSNFKREFRKFSWKCNSNPRRNVQSKPIFGVGPCLNPSSRIRQTLSWSLSTFFPYFHRGSGVTSICHTSVFYFKYTFYYYFKTFLKKKFLF